MELCPDPFVPEAVMLLDSMPGIGEHVAHDCLGDWDRWGPIFLCRTCGEWGRAPGNNELAGKRKSGQTTKGRQYLRTALVEAAWAATRAKGTFLAAKYYRLVKRVGKKKALVAEAHGMVRVVSHLLRRRVGYTDLGSE